jgi:lysylphosphatidylglycerol synthetase-like protein (DUF2156 family)
MRERLRHSLPAITGVVLFIVALLVLRRELAHVTWQTLSHDVMNTPPARLAGAILLTAINYAALTGYDLIAFAYIGRRFPRRHIAAVSFLAYAIANNVGFAMWSGASVRYRFYTRWGITVEELSRIVFSYTVTFWLGLLALGGLSLALSPLPRAENLPAGGAGPLMGWTLLGISAAYVAAARIRHEPFRLRGFELPMPSARLALIQLAVSATEWSLAGAVLYVLLPPSDASFLTVLGAFLLAQLLGLASHVPGGVGVFEGMMVILLKPFFSSGQLIPALVVYRAIYYLMPLTLALVALVADGVRRRRSLAALLAGLRLLSDAPHRIDAPSDEDLRAAGQVIAGQRATYPFLVYLRDKALLFDEHREAFVMYSMKGRTWAALGDPVGPHHRIPELIRTFLEQCDRFGGTPVFYEVGEEHLHHYADFGLTFIKLGEEARVDLTTFSLDGPPGARYRQAIRRLDKDGGTFRIVQAAGVPGVMSQLRLVSDDWLHRKSGAEKGFSMGHFDPEYISRFPVAVIEHGGQIRAFANVWTGADRQEISLDLMRYHHEAPTGIMEALFAHMLVWGKNEGYQAFSLGMAPMSGFEQSPVAPLWTRVGIFLYEHGEPLYHFQGLRAYKEKFKPEWRSRYLAYPGGLRLPRILADVSALVAGGYRRIFVK